MLLTKASLPRCIEGRSCMTLMSVGGTLVVRVIHFMMIARIAEPATLLLYVTLVSAWMEVKLQMPS